MTGLGRTDERLDDRVRRRTEEAVDKILAHRDAREDALKFDTANEAGRPGTPPAIATIHPREILLRDINYREQMLLEKLHLIRQERELVQGMDYDQADRIIKLARIGAAQQDQPSRF